MCRWVLKNLANIVEIAKQFFPGCLFDWELQFNVIQEKTGKYRDVWNMRIGTVFVLTRWKSWNVFSFLSHRIACRIVSCTKRWPEVYLQLFLSLKKANKNSEATFRGEKEGKDTLEWDLHLAFSTRLLASIIFLLSCSEDLSIVVQVWFVLYFCVSWGLNSVNKQKERVQEENSNLAAALSVPSCPLSFHRLEMCVLSSYTRFWLCLLCHTAAFISSYYCCDQATFPTFSRSFFCLQCQSV